MSKIKIDEHNLVSTLNRDIKLVVMSDIHQDKKDRSKMYDNISSKLDDIQPNYILMPGDIIKSKAFDLKYLNEFLIRESKRCKIIIGHGNHEAETIRDTGNVDWFYQLGQTENVHVLYNSGIYIDDIFFASFSTNVRGYLPKNKGIMGNIYENQYKNSNIVIPKEAKYKILLSHNLDCLRNGNVLKKLGKNIDYDLYVGGHYHNGWVPTCMEKVMNKRGIFGPYSTLLPMHCRDIEILDNGKPAYTSRGVRTITMNGFLPGILDEIYPNNIGLIKIKSIR